MINEKVFEKRIAGIYKIHVNHAHINLWNMGVSIKGIELKADTSEEAQELYKYQKNIAHVQIKRLTIANIGLIKFFKENKVDIHRITFISPHIKLTKNPLYTGSPPEIPKKSADSAQGIDEIFLGQLNIKNLSLDYYLYGNKDPDLSIESIHLALDQPIIDPNQFKSIDKALLIKEIKLEVNNILFKDEKGQYEMTLEQIAFEDSASIIRLKNFKIKPLLSKKKFAQLHAFQSDRFDGQISEIIISQLDIDRLIKQEGIAVQNIQVSGADLELYRDKNRPFNDHNFPKLPQQALRSLKQIIEINQIEISSANIVYAETAKGGDLTGKVLMKDIQATLKNIGNSDAWKRSKTLTINAEAKVFGKGPLHAQFEFPLANSTFHFSGKLGKTKMNAFNEMVIPNAGVKIKSGTINEMSFDITANNTSSHGTLELYYENLAVSILKEKLVNGHIIEKERKFFNFLANKVVLPVQNPNKKGSFYSASVEFDRDINKSIFNYLWKSIFSGVKDTFLKGHKTESLNKQVEEGKIKTLTKKEKRRLAKEEKKK